MSDYFGSIPKTRRIALTKGQDFNLVIRYKDAAGTVANWPGGSTLVILFDNGATWTASIATSLATFAIDKTITESMPTGTGYRMVYGPVDLVPYKGTVVRSD